MKTKTQTQFAHKLANKLEIIFPKGERDENGHRLPCRSKALTFNAYANIYMEEAEQEIKKQLKSRLEVILTDPDNYLRGQLEDLIKEL